MKYVLMNLESPADFAARTNPDQAQGYFTSWIAYSDAMRAAGIVTGGDPLQPADTSTTVRLRHGQRQVQQGPYAQTEDQMGGYFVIDVPDLDTAIEWAAKAPAAATGAVEIRPILPSPVRPK